MAFTQEQLDLCAKKLGDMVRVPTVSKAEHEDLSDFYRFHQVLEDLFPLIHKTLEKTVLNGSLLYRWQGTDPSKLPVLLMGHQDVVPASDEGWTVPAYSGQVIDGNLYGRGALDCKSTMFVELQAVEELLAEGFTPAMDVYLAFSINEETGGDGAAAIVRHLQAKGIRLAMAIDEGGAIMDRAVEGMDRPYAVIGIMEKGYMDVKTSSFCNRSLSASRSFSRWNTSKGLHTISPYGLSIQTVLFPFDTSIPTLITFIPPESKFSNCSSRTYYHSV